MTTESLQDFFTRCQNRCNQQLDQLLPAQPDHLLQEAMRYAALIGGKRIRPILCYATAELLGNPMQQVDNIACAIELIHAYSLVHDDLPAMDNDTLRRGQATCHIKFGEAQAILAGDALQALALELIATPTPHIPPLQQLKIVQALGHASGHSGMAGGQSLDLLSEGKTISLNELETIHRKKTGALLEACVTLSAMACNADAATLANLQTYAQHIGLCFQVQDDILDVIGNTTDLGKTQGADQQANKATYPALLGLAGAQTLAKDLHKAAQQALSSAGPSAHMLRQIADFILIRAY